MVATVNYSGDNYNGANNDHLGGPIGIWVWECDAVTIQNNYSHDNVGCRFLVYQYYGARPQRNNVARYNVSVGDGRTNGGALAVGGGANGTLTTFRGNQFVVQGGVLLVGVLDTAQQYGIYFTGNTYSVGVNPFAIRWGKKNYSNLSAWRKATGQEP